jgi:hypothetical protein
MEHTMNTYYRGVRLEREAAGSYNVPDFGDELFMSLEAACAAVDDALADPAEEKESGK